MFRRFSLALAFGLLAAHSASAMSLRELRTLEKNEGQGDVHALYYLVGALEGALEAQAKAVRLGAKPSFCPLERRQAELYEADMPAPLVLLNALGTVYPCN